jgi:hypothetical protein
MKAAVPERGRGFFRLAVRNRAASYGSLGVSPTGVLRQTSATLKGLSCSLWGALRGHNRELGKHFEVASVESVNSLNSVRLHGRYDLQIEQVATGDGVAL